MQSFGTDPRDPKKAVGYGSPVEAGTVLARLDDTLFRARVDQARGRVAKAEADVEQAEIKLGQLERERDRTQKLRARNAAIVAAQDYDAAVTKYETARAALCREPGRAGHRAGQPRGGRGQPRLHDDPLPGQGRDPRPPGQHRPDASWPAPASPASS